LTKHNNNNNNNNNNNSFLFAEINHLDERIILKWTFRQWDGEAWTGLVWFRTGAAGGRL